MRHQTKIIYSMISIIYAKQKTRCIPCIFLANPTIGYRIGIMTRDVQPVNSNKTSKRPTQW